MSDPMPSNIFQLSSSNFTQTGDLPNSKGIVFIAFYSPNCGHCRMFCPKFAEFSNNTKTTCFGMNVAKNRDIYSKQLPFQVNGVPMTVVYVNGKPCSFISGNRPDALYRALDDARREMCCIGSGCNY